MSRFPYINPIRRNQCPIEIYSKKKLTLDPAFQVCQIYWQIVNETSDIVKSQFAVEPSNWKTPSFNARNRIKVREIDIPESAWLRYPAIFMRSFLLSRCKCDFVKKGADFYASPLSPTAAERC